MDDPQALLILNGVPHHLSKVLQNARIAPTVEIKIEDINALPHCGGPAESLVRHQPETVAGTEREIVFFKQNGGYTILTGRKKFEQQAQGVVKGKLLSTPMLKKCRVEEAPGEVEQREQALEVDRLRDQRSRFEDRSYRGVRIEIPRRYYTDANKRLSNA